MDFQNPCDGRRPEHIDSDRLIDVIDGLQELSDAESEHLTRCNKCLEAVRLAAREVVRKRREYRLQQAKQASTSSRPATT